MVPQEKKCREEWGWEGGVDSGVEKKRGGGQHKESCQGSETDAEQRRKQAEKVGSLCCVPFRVLPRTHPEDEHFDCWTRYVQTLVVRCWRMGSMCAPHSIPQPEHERRSMLRDRASGSGEE